MAKRMTQAALVDMLIQLAETIDLAHAAVHTGPVCGTSDEDYSKMTVQQLALLMNLVQSVYDEADSVKKKLGTMYDELRIRHIPSKMEDEGLESMKITDLGTLMLTDDLRIKVLDSKREFEWLEQTLNGDLIKDTVNASSLKALIRRWIVAGNVVPADIFEVTPFVRASIKKR
jgi:hypothetical protein